MRPFCCGQNKGQTAHLSKVRNGRISRKVASTANTAMPQLHVDAKFECQNCHQMVKNLAKHNLRFHTDKFWGYKCDICSHCECRLDNSFFKKHMLNMHNIVVHDINVYKTNVVCGYKVPMKCPICPFQCFQANDMKYHFHIVHPVSTDTVSNQNPREGSIENVEHNVSVSSLEIPDAANSAQSYEMDLLEMSVYLLNLDENVSDFENEFDDELDLLAE